MTANWGQATPCRDGDPEEWFSIDNQTNQRAQDLCSGCPVLHPCRQYALHRNEFGVWGGTTRRHRLHTQKRLGIEPATERGPRPRPPVKALALLERSDRLRAKGLSIPAIAAQFEITEGWLKHARAKALRHLAEVSA